MKNHPYIDVVKISSLLFFPAILIIIFLALYITNVIAYTPDQTDEQARANTAPVGQVYRRE